MTTAQPKTEKNWIKDVCSDDTLLYLMMVY